MAGGLLSTVVSAAPAGAATSLSIVGSPLVATSVGAQVDRSWAITGAQGTVWFLQDGSPPSGVAVWWDQSGIYLSGAPAAGTAGEYLVTIGIADDTHVTVLLNIDIQVKQVPAFTSGPTYVLAASAGATATVTTSGWPVPYVMTSALPVGITFANNGDGTGTLTNDGTAVPGNAGFDLQADEGVNIAAQSATLSVVTPVTFTSADTATLSASTGNAFTVTTTGTPAPAITASGLPTGVALTDYGNGIASLSASPGTVPGTYSVILSATNGGVPASQTLAVTVTLLPAITSADSVTFTQGVTNTFTVTTTGSPAPALSVANPLPVGVTFTDHGDGTATFAGDPATYSAPSYQLTLHATSGATFDLQNFTLNVVGVPVITSGGGRAIFVGSPAAFSFTAVANPAVTSWSASGTLPAGVTLGPDGAFSGTAAARTGGLYDLQVTATNDVGSTPSSFTLEVVEAPYFTTGAATTFAVGTAGTFTAHADGYPVPDTYTETGALPDGVTLSPGGVLAGTPAAGTAGTYPITVTASNGSVNKVVTHSSSPHMKIQTGTQAFTLTVGSGTPPPASSVATTGGSSIAALPDGSGFWVSSASGAVTLHGAATSFGSQHELAAPVVGMAASADGQGYWEVAADGGVFAFGDAAFFGSMGGKHLNAPIVGMAATADGHGYWLVASDGGIFAYGDASFHGGAGAEHLNAPIVGMTGAPGGQGYWLVASDGGVFAYGDAGFAGSAGGIRLNQPVVGIANTPSGRGYWLVASDGGVFAYGDATFVGALPMQGGAPIGILSVTRGTDQGYTVITGP